MHRVARDPEIHIIMRGACCCAPRALLVTDTKEGDPMLHDSAYLLEASAKTRSLGLVTSAILLPAVSVFIYIDSVVPLLREAIWWRLEAILPAVLYLVYGLLVFPKGRRLAIPLHAIQLAALMIMLCGHVARLATLPGFPVAAKTALSTSLLVGIFACFAFAGGARRYLSAILLAPLATMSMYVVVAGRSLSEGERLWLLANPIVMAIGASVLALYQEKSSAKEFMSRWELGLKEKALRESQDKYQQLFENADVGMFRTELIGSKITEANHKFLELAGRNREEIIGTPLAMHWADPSEYGQMMQELTRSDRLTNFECHISNSQGEGSTCLASLRLHREERLIEGSLLDITERKVLEAEREAALQRLEFVIATTRTGMDIIDEDYQIRYIDPARRNTMGDPAGRPCYRYFLGRSSPCESCGMQKALATRELHVQEQTLPSDEGRITQITSLPYQDKAGKWLVAEVIVDITERKKAEAERLELERRVAASQKLEGLGILAGGVAHNFNNLLTIILGYARLLEEMNQGIPAMLSSVKEIIKAVERSRELVDQLLSLRKQQALKLRPVDLNTVINECALLLRQAVRENIAIEHHLASSVCPIDGDPARLELVLLNLALNAQDAISGRGRIEIATLEVIVDGAVARRHEDLPAGRYIRLTFGDTGEGMDAETRRKIFTPFFTTKEPGKGTGLGLYSVYGIVKQHHGKIEVDSREGDGTRFVIYFPRTEAFLRDARTPEVVRSRRGTETILLVEDEAQIRALLSHHLRSLGYVVLEAPDGKAALQAISEHTGAVDMLVTDMVMPVMNGTELWERLHEQIPGLHALFMSGYSPEVIAPYSAKTLELLIKPFTGNDLASRIREILDRPG